MMNQKFLRTGIRYDSYTQATLLLNLTLWNIGKDPGLFTVDLMLGRQQSLHIQYSFPLGVRPGLGVRVELVSDKYPVQLTTAGRTLGSFLLRSSSARAMAGMLYDRTLSIAAGLRAEYTELTPEVYSSDFTELGRRILFFGNLWMTTFDRPTYPNSGVSVRGAIDVSPFGEKAERFTRGFILPEVIIPISPKLVGLLNGFYGVASNSTPPHNYNFSLGGVRAYSAFPYTTLSTATFMGLQAQELVGVQAQMLAVGVRKEAFNNVFVQAQVNAGNTFSDTRIDFSNRKYEWGGGLTFCYLSALGPFEFSIMRGPLGKYLTFVNIGYTF